MEGNVYLTRLEPIERKIIITSVVKYLLAGKAIYGDCSSARKSTLKGWSTEPCRPKHIAIAASRAIVQSLMQSNLMILNLWGCGWG